MDGGFNEFTLIINKLNKLFLEDILLNLRNNRIKNIKPMQALLLRNIEGNPKNIKDSGDFGYYLGTNITYSTIDLEKKGYIDKLPDKEDKRAVYLVLTEKGKKVLEVLDSVNVSHLKSLQKLKIDVKNMNEILLKLQRIF